MACVSRWQRNQRSVIWHLIKKHESDLAELYVVWKPGTGEFSDALFDAQRATNEAYLRCCKGLDKGASRARRQYVANYAVRQRARTMRSK
eukprot:2258857-Lingulodinium_polyedra.AAC.1